MGMMPIGEPATFSGTRGIYTLQRMRDEGPPFNTACVLTLPGTADPLSLLAPAGWTSDDGSSGTYSSDEGYAQAEVDCRRIAAQFDRYEFDPEADIQR